LVDSSICRFGKPPDELFDRRISDELANLTV